MKIKNIRLNYFKRFTDTTVGPIAETTKLVLITGPNGCGKSSLIDAVNYFHRSVMSERYGFEQAYHLKQIPNVSASWDQLVKVEFHSAPQSLEDRKRAIYVRSAYRNDPEFELSSLSRIGPAIDENRFARLIDNDQAVSRNYTRLVSNGFEQVFDDARIGETFGEFRERLIGKIRNSMERLFPGLQLNSLGNPLTEGTFKFDKGDSKSFLYKNLSAGEKSAFDLLLDIHVKSQEFNNTVFFIDEPEAHMSTALQSLLLEELHNLLPEDGQLWIATHSIGMMRKARDLFKRSPGTVAFLDMDGANFDVPTEIAPIAPDRPFWKRAMQIALDDIAGYVAPDRVVVCEGNGIQPGSNFDAECYNDIFKIEFPEIVFLGGGNADDVANDPRGVQRLLSALTPNVDVIRLIDRDDQTDDEIVAWNRNGVRVLSQRNIELYLLDDRVLSDLCIVFGSPEASVSLIETKRNSLTASIASGGPPDDLKRTAGDVYLKAKQLFGERKLGNDKKSFMKAFCAPLIAPGTPIYNVLRRDVFGI